MWKARVRRVQSERKKRYWRMRGWACKRDAFVALSVRWGRGSFSMRAQVR